MLIKSEGIIFLFLIELTKGIATNLDKSSYADYLRKIAK